MANNWAIVVGVNDYDFLPDASLRFAVNDALAMKAWLCDQAGFPEAQVLLCGDGTSGTRKATRPVLRDILLHQIQRAQNADNLWFFFSGHGLDEHLMTIDGNPKDLSDTAISINFVADRLRSCQAKSIVVILDMCRNESHDMGQKSATSMEESLKRLAQDREGQQGIIKLLSCGQGESSYEIASLERGAFTHALLEGLEQTSILRDLETYLQKRVVELHKNAGKTTRKQVPLVIPAPGWKYDEPILSHYATEIDVARIKEMAIDAEADDEIEKAIRLWEKVNLQAEDAGDRLRALNRIRNLMARSEPTRTNVPHVDPTPSQQKSIDDIPLESEKGINYQKLRNLLKAGKWEEADQETLLVMLQATKRQKMVLDGDCILTFPCKDLRTIDQLWVNASNGHFGFSVQRKIWEECDRPTSSGKDWDIFCTRVGWQAQGEEIPYDDLKKHPTRSNIGELPACVLEKSMLTSSIRTEFTQMFIPVVGSAMHLYKTFQRGQRRRDAGVRVGAWVIFSRAKICDL
jgi:GUN4-like/Caspase domain